MALVTAISRLQLDKDTLRNHYFWNWRRDASFFKPMTVHPFLSVRHSFRINRFVGEVYDFDFNRFRLKSFSIVSRKDHEMVVKIDGANGLQHIPIRTDGLYRQIQNRGIYHRKLHQIGIRGRWVSPHILHLDCLIVDNPHKVYVTLFFIGKELFVAVREETKQWNRLWVRGRLRNL